MRLRAFLLVCLGLTACPPAEPGSCKEDGECRRGEACCDGRCRNVETDSTNCGGCNVTCDFPNSTPSCNAGRCQLNCKPGFGNCNGARDDGCEYVTANDVDNCGVCGRVCMSINAAPVCSESRCATGACDTHWENCDDDDINGCEVDTRVTLQHCGACGNACVLANATARCTNSACAVASCAADFGDCDGQPGNGCERDFRSDALHCGACNFACGPGQQCVDSQCRANELILFGGSVGFVDSTVTREVTKLDLSTNQFVAITPTGNLPGRTRHVAAWDLPRNRMLVFGGIDGAGTAVANDTWALDFGVEPPAWSRLTTTGTPPTPRFGSAAAVDTREWKLYLFGGITEAGAPLSDFYVLDLATATWTALHDSNADGGPSNRYNARAAFDPTTKKVLLYGGNHGVINTDLGELWQFDTAAQRWLPSPIPPFPAGWAPARAAGALYGGHPVRLFSGVTNLLQNGSPAAAVQPDLYDLDVTASDPWSLVGLFDQPRPRFNAAFVERDGVLYLYGGGEVDNEGRRTLHDFWAFTPDGGTWSLLNDGGVGGSPTARLSSTMVAR